MRDLPPPDVIDLAAYRLRRLSTAELAASIADTTAILAEQPPDDAPEEYAYLEQLLAELRTRETATRLR